MHNDWMVVGPFIAMKKRTRRLKSNGLIDMKCTMLTVHFGVELLKLNEENCCFSGDCAPLSGLRVVSCICSTQEAQAVELLPPRSPLLQT